MSETNVKAFLRDLWSQGVEFWLENDQIRFKGNKQLVTGETLGKLRENKQEIIEIIRKTPQAFLGFPLSNGQRAIYLMQSVANDSHAYNLTCLLALNESIDLEALQTSFDLLLQRHAPLRMSIENLDDQLAQQVSYSLPSILSFDKSHVKNQKQWQAWISETADKPFQLDAEPLIRARLLNNEKSPYHNHLLIVAHHIIADYWALELIVKELEAIYKATTEGKSADLPEIGKLYKDYVIQEKEWLKSDKGLEAKHYWHNKLTPLPPTLSLPYDFTRPSHPSFKGNEITFHLGKKLTKELKAQAKAAHVTPFIWCLSCYQILLHRYSGESRVSIGSPVACRTQKDYQLLAGHFTNPVVLTADFDQTTSFKGTLQHNKEQMILSMKYQEYPLQCLIEELQPQHTLTDAPLFQTAISWNQLDQGQSLSHSLVEDIVLMEQRGSIYNLVMTCYDKGDDIQVAWRFNTDLFKQESIERTHQHFINILTNSFIKHQEPIASFEFLTSDEISKITRVNATESEYPNDKNLAKIFQEKSTEYGSSLAFTYKDQAYTYLDVEKSSNQFAHFLTDSNIAYQDKIALCIPRSYEMLICLMGALKAGVTYIPVDPEFPEERIQGICDTANVKALFCLSKNEDKLSTIKIANNAIHSFDKLASSLKALPEDYAIHNNGLVSEEDVACIFFTSGSTGTPKGVQVPHQAPARLVLNTNYLNIAPGDNVCHLSNVSFDASNIEIWSALLNGGYLSCIDNETLLSPALFSEYIDEKKPVIAFITTMLFNIFIHHKPDIFKDFKCLMFGGEAADHKQTQRCFAEGKPETLLNVYGPTENGSLSTFYPITESPENKEIPIGFPISNCQVYVHDPYGNPMPIGVTGEIIVGGDGVSLGYLGQDELTAEKFIPDHYRGKGRLYKTGDLGFMREDGAIVYNGRVDDLVKIRGYRIELGEIEQSLSHHPEIEQSHVAVINREGNHHLVAYFTANKTIDTTALKQHLRKELPEFMVPSAVMQLDSIPVNPNGKVDKRYLPEVELGAETEFVEPNTLLERKLTKLWQDTLGIEKIGIYDNFFELGGHSLLAVKLAGAIQESLDTEINMRLIFEHPYIADLAEAIQTISHNKLPEIEKIPSRDNIPASLMQQRLWFLQQLSNTSTAYNMPIAMRFPSPLKASEVEDNILTLIKHHETFRTTFTDHQGIAYLNIKDGIDWKLQTLDLSRLQPKEAEKQAKNQINMIANHIFDLETGPLIKAIMIQMPQGETVLAFCLHHIIIDGWSVDVLFSELSELWLDDKATIENNNTLDYADFSQWQRQWIEGEYLSMQKNYWKEQLQGASTLLNLPTDKPRPPVLSANGDAYSFEINEELVNRLRNLGHKHNATLFMVIASAYSILLSRYSQQTDVCIGFPISGRNHKKLENMIGLFVNNLVLRCHLNDNPSVSDYLQQIKATTIEAYSHQDVPFDLIVDTLQIDRTLSYTPYLQASFSLENGNFEDKVKHCFNNDVELIPMDWHVAKYDLNLTCFERQDGIEATIEFSTDLFEKDSIARMASHFIRVLDQLTDPNTHTVNEIQILSNDERQQFALDWDQQRDLNKRTFINAVNRFEIQAGKHANKTALCFEDETLSYQQLNAQANQLARYLQLQGIESGDYVGLYIERTKDIVISILAILKAGATYVPLDPHAPADRINYIIEDAGISNVICHQSLADNLSGNTIIIDRDKEKIAQLDTDNLNIYIPIDASAYIIYTSGTTGKPKGCIVTHRNLARLFTATEENFQFNEHDVWTLFHSYAFDFSVWEIWGALLYGGKLVVIPHWLSRAPDQFYQTLVDHKVTVLNQTPSAFSQLIAIDQLTEASNLSLRYIIFGGEALDFSALQQWVSKHPITQTRLINMYGITETTVHVTYHEITESDLSKGRSIIGQAISDLHIHLLDSNGQIAPIGVLGEMYISGSGVTNGYLNRPELTNERFLPNPFTKDMPRDLAQYHQRMYRSGDLARRLSNGDIEYLGRIDHQVKIRGHRIELGEIEAVLSNIDEISESIVISREDTPGNKALVAYLLTPESADLDLTAVRHILKAALPDYMIPANFVCLSEWPLTANGKIDKLQLPAPDDSDINRAPYVAPRNETEVSICQIWSEILGIEKVGIHDNFFELGGHSLLATQVASQIRTTLECALELKAIFENPTVAELALVILEQEIDELEMDDESLLELLNELEDEDLP